MGYGVSPLILRQPVCFIPLTLTYAAQVKISTIPHQHTSFTAIGEKPMIDAQVLTFYIGLLYNRNETKLVQLFEKW